MTSSIKMIYSKESKKCGLSHILRSEIELMKQFNKSPIKLNYYYLKVNKDVILFSNAFRNGSKDALLYKFKMSIDKRRLKNKN